MTRICTSLCFSKSSPLPADNAGSSCDMGSRISKIFLTIRVFITNLYQDLLYGPRLTQEQASQIEVLGRCIQEGSDGSTIANELLEECNHLARLFNYRVNRELQIPERLRGRTVSSQKHYQAGLNFIADYTYRLKILAKITDRQNLYRKARVIADSGFNPDTGNKLRYSELYQLHTIHQLGQMQRSMQNKGIHINVVRDDEVAAADTIIAKIWEKHGLDNAHFACFREDSSSLFKRSRISCTHSIRAFVRGGTQVHSSMVYLKSPESYPRNSHIALHKYHQNELSFSEYICSGFFSLNPEKFVDAERLPLLKRLWSLETDLEVHQRVRQLFEAEFKKMHESEHGFSSLKNTSWRRIQTVLGFKKSWRKQDPKDIDFSQPQLMNCSEFQAKMIAACFYRINQQLLAECQERRLLSDDKAIEFCKSPFSSHLKLHKITPALLARRFLPKIADWVRPSLVLQNIMDPTDNLFLP